MRAARSLATSMKKFMPMQKKNESLGANLSMSMPRGERGAHVLHAVRQGEGKLLDQVGSGLLHVIAGDGDRVEPGHVLGGEGDDVGDDPHRLSAGG